MTSPATSRPLQIALTYSFLVMFSSQSRDNGSTILKRLIVLKGRLECSLSVLFLLLDSNYWAKVDLPSSTYHINCWFIYCHYEITHSVTKRITKFYKHIHADLHYICTGYDVTIYFRPEATAKKPSKMPPQTASGGISRERFKQGSPNFTRLSGPLVAETCRIWRHSLLPVSCEMQLNTAQKWCVKRVRSAKE